MKFKLDFSIQSAEERMEAIKQIPLESLTKTELNTVTEYVLYGKDPDGTSSVDRKEIFIKTKFNSYQKNLTTSLDALMESPTFDENIFLKDQTRFKNSKPDLVKDLKLREKAKLVPGMQELWDSIDQLNKIYKQNTGKEDFEEGTPKLNQTELYYLKHQLIELRKEQYELLKSSFPFLAGKKNKAEYYQGKNWNQLEMPILPRGLMKEAWDLDFTEPFGREGFKAAALQDEQKILEGNKPYIDFRNKDHLYQLILFYGDLKAFVQNQPDSIIWNLLWTIDFYISKANLSQQQRLIVEDKKFRFQNKEIKAHLEQELGISHRENYISTIWNKALDLIVEAVELNYDEFLCKDYKPAWKTCSCCKKILLRDPRNFVRKSKAADGLTNRCKQCDKIARQSRK